MARSLTRAEEILGALVSDDEWHATYASEAVRQGDMGSPAPQKRVTGKSPTRIPKPRRKPFKSVGDIGELRDYLKAKNQGARKCLANSAE
jgi:hypothetical protein